jgi:RNA dependent RNA polymerase
MEISMSNVPPEFTDFSLGRQLRPLIDALGIKHWKCSKPRRKKFAQLLFLNQKDGTTFLGRYGVVEIHSRGRPRLHLLNTPIFCRAKNGEPDIWALRSLQLQVEEKSTRKDIQESSDGSISFKLKNFACGHCTFRDGHLIFVPDIFWLCTGVAKFTHRFLTIKLDGLAKLQIPLHAIIEVISGTRRASLTVTLCESPVMSSLQSSEAEIGLLFQSLGLGGRNRNIPTHSRINAIDSSHSQFTQYSLVYSFETPSTEYGYGVSKLQRRESLTVTPFDLQWGDADEEFHRDLASLRSTLESFTKKNSLSFQVLFQLQKLVNNGYLPAKTVHVLAMSIQLLQSGASVNNLANITDDETAARIKISAEAIKRLMPQIPFLGPDADSKFFDVQNLLKLLITHEEDLQNEQHIRTSLTTESDNMALIHRVTVSPTRITLQGPEWESKNRILRKYPNHHDFFIRVRFADENGESVFFDFTVDQDHVYERFKVVMNKGIQIAGRSFSFLGFSHSSLRSQTVWFCAPFFHDGKLHTNFNIIDALGTFSHITSPAKCAARIGQAFSETPIAIPLDDYGVTVSDIDDVESSDKQRIFTDGVGTISKSLVDIINTDYLPRSKGYPTCFQIRYAGAKGMLSMDNRLQGHKICVRPSMVKFSGNDKSYLELCDIASTPIPLFFNRQIIKILEDMDVPESWFFKLQNQELDRLRHVMVNGRTIAKFLKRQVGQPIGLCHLYRFLYEFNIDFRQDRFLRSIVEIIVLQELRLLKHKARIPVDQGVTLFGVVDESGLLKENEVYVTFDSHNGKKTNPPSERVLVTRSPALHPGDIQMAKHVIPPQNSPLSHLSNCIVFSKHGSRDLPSKLSGGDLDGDIYNVIWAKEAVQGAIKVHNAADYPRSETIDLKRPVEKEDMIDFFINFMKTDHLGVIATRHMILADQKLQGTLDRDCLTLAERHSEAVDFSKSGKAVAMNTLPRAAPYRPDL